MNIYKSIKAIWAADTQLASMLPVDRVHIGRAEGDVPVRPYAVLTLLTTFPAFRTSKANTDRDLFQIAIYADRYDEAAQIQAVAREVLRDSHPVADDGTVVLFEKAEGSRVVTEGRVTQAIDQFFCEVSKTRRA